MTARYHGFPLARFARAFSCAENAMPADWPGMTDAAPYAWTGAGGLVGRLMFHAHQVQRGKRKPLSWVLAADLPIGLGMGWLTLGGCDWFGIAAAPSISLAIAAGHLGPYSIDRVFAALAERYFKSGAGAEVKS
jgi:hypothetical protein